jgi:hypothetical protein
MKAKLYIGHGEVSFDFEDQQSRDLFFENMGANRSAGFSPQDAASKFGDRSIRINPDQFTIGYRWPLEFTG